MRTKATLLALPLALIALAGCGSSSSHSSAASTSGTTAPSASTTSTTAGTSGTSKAQPIMMGLMFEPAVIDAKVGQTITWHNKDTATHTVEYVSGPKFKSSGNVAPGQSYSIKVTKAGTIHYTCAIHPFMHGEIVVTQ